MTDRKQYQHDYYVSRYVPRPKKVIECKQVKPNKNEAIHLIIDKICSLNPLDKEVENLYRELNILLYKLDK